MHTRRVRLDAPGQRHGATAPSPGRPTPGVVKQDQSSVDTTKTRSGPQRVRMSSGERPIGAAKGKQSDTEALCLTPPPPQRPKTQHRPASPAPALPLGGAHTEHQGLHALAQGRQLLLRLRSDLPVLDQHVERVVGLAALGADLGGQVLQPRLRGRPRTCGNGWRPNPTEV